MSKTIMIVDDSASVRQVLGMALKGAEYDVIEACDGEDALEKLKGNKIHLVVSDVNMPRMDGITFLSQLKSMSEYRFTPVIMLTTEGASDKMMAGKEAGAKAWMVKPFKPDDMLKAVSMLV